MCLTCSIVNGEFFPVGGIIYKDSYVLLHHCIDLQIPGYLILSPLRHTESYSDLNQNEMLHMGIVTKAVVAALKRIDGMEKVYLANFGEETTHFHMHIFPRYKWMLNHSAEEICTDNMLDGAKLLSFCRKKYKVQPEFINEEGIIAVIEQVKRVLSNPDL
ncbi:MAG: histidine triad protein [Firmicutes bacterium]|nr:histidine triad protein [Bacillota bacterium]